jgi:cell division protein FtsW (lipid II flippase)
MGRAHGRIMLFVTGQGVLVQAGYLPTVYTPLPMPSNGISMLRTVYRGKSTVIVEAVCRINSLRPSFLEYRRYSIVRSKKHL